MAAQVDERRLLFGGTPGLSLEQFNILVRWTQEWENHLKTKKRQYELGRRTAQVVGGTQEELNQCCYTRCHLCKYIENVRFDDFVCYRQLYSIAHVCQARNKHSIGANLPLHIAHSKEEISYIHTEHGGHKTYTR